MNFFVELFLSFHIITSKVNFINKNCKVSYVNIFIVVYVRLKINLIFVKQIAIN